MKPILIVICSVIFVECVPAPTQYNRYLQFKHPISGTVAFQIAFPNPDGCKGMLAMVNFDEKSNSMKSFFVCTSNSASATLPIRATIRNKVYSFILDLEAINSQECNSFLKGMMNGEAKDNLEVISPCTLKPMEVKKESSVLSEKMLNLKKLYDDGLITKDEYIEKKEQLLKAY